MSKGDWIIALIGLPIGLWVLYIVALMIINTVCGNCLRAH
jgi:hypothetical protein